MKIAPPLLLEWSIIYELGIEEIDRQHRQIIDVINDLFLARFEGRHDDVKKALDQACIYIIDHIGYEEDLLKKANYEHWEDHVIDHRKFTTELASCYRLYCIGAEFGERLQSLLMSWLTLHIKKEDFEFRDAVLHFLHLQEPQLSHRLLRIRKKDHQK